ncbi:hypothetical protein [Candidatus Poriferisocius sp.]|uniref:hypothetical protein n=1 Tax=Candidatus Poriferisocius sp. TaxID=3101276 RepID=UPI003B02337B
MKPEIEEALEELKECFPDSEVVSVGIEDGGVFVSIDPVDPGPAYVQQETWLKFAISFQYPSADVYPLFVRPDLARVDDGEHGEGFSRAEFNGEAALQLSRRSNRLNPAIDTACLKVNKVLAWMRAQ